MLSSGKLGFTGTSTSTTDLTTTGFKNKSIIFRKTEDNVQLYAGNKNIILGYDSGYNLRYGDENIFIGTETGYRSTGDVNLSQELRPSYNTIVGSYSGKNNTIGQENIYLGYKCVETTARGSQKHNRTVCCRTVVVVQTGLTGPAA